MSRNFTSRSKKKISHKTDFFVSKGIEYIDYKDISVLSKFINNQGRIVLRKNTLLTQKTQRRINKAIKTARQMALLPYSIKETREIKKEKDDKFIEK
ncbi:30S ribosomal protein S18 [endosymbiont GvMRE of Glomus versiforme]|uniref:30S ribosomal protein S18 n=1 Tax=endosymbiont GvMRE of Glomus versiforme TaxID=2039283 RepID=UPI000ED209B8|nr:30S ribosomal protein S18 [endosymbiont GvMRE of Glomus versiforme]RHZ35227.1 30S ribosomal protein S18 [endosymbiont GvMRE of Glomus versiforme]